MEPVAAVTCIPVFEARETVVVLRAVGLAGLGIHGQGGFDEGVQSKGGGGVGAAEIGVRGESLGGVRVEG